MGLLKVTEFAEKYGLERTNVYTYKKRGKLIITEGYIDEANPVNKIFVDSREISPKVKVKPSQKKEYETTIPDSQPIEATQEIKEKTRRITRAVSDPLYLEFQATNKLRVQKTELENRLAQIRIDKIEGKLIPTDMVTSNMVQLFTAYKSTFLQQTEQLLRDVLNELQAGNERITRTCSRLTDISNESSKHALTELKMIVQNIINENNART